MADARDLKLFISWSGDLSKAVAQALYHWVPKCSDRVTPFMSEVDVEAGQRAMSVLESELAGTSFGIIVVTQANQNAPWLNYEAGALSKQITEDRETHVAPLLVDIDSAEQVKGPLHQFQAKPLNKEGIRAVMRSVGKAAGN